MERTFPAPAYDTTKTYQELVEAFIASQDNNVARGVSLEELALVALATQNGEQ